MDILSIIIIGIGLAMDCFAVSISKGIYTKKYFFGLTFRMALLFGLFQAAMPLIGYAAGISFVKLMTSYDHWLAFGLLSIIGVKMVVEGLKIVDPESNKVSNPFNWISLISLAFATSIDALATGIVFVPYPELIWKAVAVIGIISFLFTIIGMYIGVHFGKRFHVKVEAIGGFILIGIGFRILIQHLYS
ncbi:MAG TPA: manganese efflux pump MntP family protein [Paludibacter sp.]